MFVTNRRFVKDFFVVFACITIASTGFVFAQEENHVPTIINRFLDPDRDVEDLLKDAEILFELYSDRKNKRSKRKKIENDFLEGILRDLLQNKKEKPKLRSGLIAALKAQDDKTEKSALVDRYEKELLAVLSESNDNQEVRLAAARALAPRALKPGRDNKSINRAICATVDNGDDGPEESAEFRYLILEALFPYLERGEGKISSTSRRDLFEAAAKFVADSAAVVPDRLEVIRQIIVVDPEYAFRLLRQMLIQDDISADLEFYNSLVPLVHLAFLRAGIDAHKLDEALCPLIKALPWEDEELYTAVLTALGAIEGAAGELTCVGEQLLNHLTLEEGLPEQLTEPSRKRLKFQIGVARTYAKIGSSEADRVLQRLDEILTKVSYNPNKHKTIKLKDAEMRSMAIEAIGEFGADAINWLESLQGYLSREQEPSLVVVATAAGAIGKIGFAVQEGSDFGNSQDTFSSLLRAFELQDYYVNWAVAYAIPAYLERRSNSDIEGDFKIFDSYFQEQGSMSIDGMVGILGLGTLPANVFEAVANDSPAAEESGTHESTPSSFEQLQADLVAIHELVEFPGTNISNKYTHWPAIWAVGEIGGRWGVVDQPDERVQTEVERCAETLSAALQKHVLGNPPEERSDNYITRRYIVEAIAELGIAADPDEFLGGLSELLNPEVEEDPRVRKAAAVAIHHLLRVHGWRGLREEQTASLQGSLSAAMQDKSIDVAITAQKITNGLRPAAQ